VPRKRKRRRNRSTHSKNCERWEVEHHKDVVRFLKRHTGYVAHYQALKELIRQDPYVAGERLSGRCKWLWKARRGELRVVYSIHPGECKVRIWRAGLRENIYEGLC